MCTAPILEICEVLASRGHAIEFATLEGRQGLVNPYSVISAVRIVGRAITAAEDEQLYLRYTFRATVEEFVAAVLVTSALAACSLEAASATSGLNTGGRQT